VEFVFSDLSVVCLFPQVIKWLNIIDARCNHEVYISRTFKSRL